MGGAVRRRVKPNGKPSSRDKASLSQHGATSLGSRSHTLRHGNSNSLIHNSAAGRSTHYPNLTLTLARGATARALHPSLLQPLAADEMEKDLRHMQAYADATKSYRQQFFLQASRRLANQSHGGGAAPLSARHSGSSANHATNNNNNTLVQLPVRIDPEEEKRLALLRAKIRRAEVVRAEAEQHYVASRAHYVRLVQDLQVSHEQRTHVLTFLQKLVHARAALVAAQRVRVQCSRDVAVALQARVRAIHAAAPPPSQDNGAAAAVTTTPYTAHLAGDDPLTHVYTTAEEDYKKAVAGCVTIDKRKKALPWNATYLPSQPRGIPALLSAAATVPDKAVAISARGVLGAKPSCMVWLEGHLPRPEDEETAQEIEAVVALEEQVRVLEDALSKERAQNVAITQAVGQTRVRNDEWVSMMGLLRQETEAVLHRHNTILQSAPARKAAEELHAAQAAQDSQLAAASAAQGALADDAGPTDADAVDSTADTTDVATSPAPADEANDGDDEDSNEDDEEGGDWNNTTNTNSAKRPAEAAVAPAAPEDSPRSKRRRL
jgi:hypothetical protein